MEEKVVNKVKHEKTLISNHLINGMVTMIKMEKGYGFIEYDKDTDFKALGVVPPSKNLFFHFSSVVGGPTAFKLIRVGEKVLFKLAVTNKGNEAINVNVQADFTPLVK